MIAGDRAMLGPYRALDLCNENGALCGKMFADLGADVIKVERPGGDPSRGIGPFYRDEPHPEKSLLWFSYNTSKRSITLNLETAEGRMIFKDLVSSADFVFESFPPGYMQRLGIGYEDLAGVKPDLIVTSITPFGQTGPHAGFKGGDLVAATTGSMMGAGYPDRAPLRFGVEQSYPQAGAQAAAASMIALHHRQLTGEGQHIDVSVQECMVMTLMSIAQRWDLAGMVFKRSGVTIERGHVNPTCIFKCKDGYISWELWVADQGTKTNALAELMKDWNEVEPEVAGVDFAKQDMLAVTQPQLQRWETGFAKFFARHTKTELHREAVKRDIMLFPICTIEDLTHDEQLHTREFWAPVSHPELGGAITYPGAPFKSSQDCWSIRRRPPLIGEHNSEIYQKELGMTDHDLRVLKEQGVI